MFTQEIWNNFTLCLCIIKSVYIVFNVCTTIIRMQLFKVCTATNGGINRWKSGMRGIYAVSFINIIFVNK